MQRRWRYLAIIVVGLGLASLAIGIAFFVEGQSKLNFMKEAMRLEKSTLGITSEELAEGNIVDTPDEAQKAGDVIREHRRGICSDLQRAVGRRPF